MRLISFLIALAITVALIIALNNPIGSIPPIGKFISPQQGFWQNADPSDKNFSSTLSFLQIKNSAQVFFDDRMVPHVFAKNDDDAYFIQGYLHAKFRLWQMEFQTFAAAGRLSEVLGAGPDSAYLNNDRYMRRIGMVYGAKHSLAEVEKDPVSLRVINSYTAGVNSYIENISNADLPLEYRLLNYLPEKWSNLKTELFLKYMSYELTGFDNDIEHTNAKSFFSESDYNKLYPLFQDTSAPIVPAGTAFVKPLVNPVVPPGADSAYFLKKADSVYISPLNPDKNNGSNNWAVSGSKTKSGRPILCNDPHLGLNLPSLWYEMQINTPSANVYGVSLPGSPLIIIGFNDSISWGVTNASRDVKDYYSIKFKDESKSSYWFNNEWKPADLMVETYKLKDGSTVYDTVSYTVFGPVLYDNNFNGKGRSPAGENLAVRWTAHDPSNEMKALYSLNLAKNYNDYTKAISFYGCPGQNFVFASKSGDIAIWQQGKFPAKWKGQGDFIMPGTDSSYMWQGFIPQEEQAHVLNPERGFVSSANQLAADSTYPYYLGGDYELYRAVTINKLLTGMNNVVPEDLQKMQNNNFNGMAQSVVPLLLTHLNNTGFSNTENEYQQLIKSWDFTNNMEGTAPTIFKLWYDSLNAVVWNDEMSKVSGKNSAPDEFTLIQALLKDTAFSFIDNINTTEKENLTDEVTEAFKKIIPAIDYLKSAGKLTWSKYKDAGVRHLLRMPPFSRYHLNTGGGYGVINALQQFHGPSWRMVVEMTDETVAYGIYPGGQSGNPGSKYYDSFIDDWSLGKYNLLWVMKRGDEGNKKIIYSMNISRGFN